MKRLMDILSTEGRPAFECWAYRALLLGVFGIAFSIALGQGAMLLSLLLLTVHLVRARRWPDFPFVCWTAAFIIVAILTCIYGQNPLKGVPRMDRLFWFVVIPLSATLIRSPDRFMGVLRAFSIGCTVLFLEVAVQKPIEVLQKMGEGGKYEGLTFGEALTDRGSMTDGEMLMLGVVVTFMLILHHKKYSRQALIWCGMFVLQFAALAVNMKRGSFFCGVGVVGLISIFRCRREVFLGLVLLVALLAWSPPGQHRLAAIKDQFDVRYGARWGMWTIVTPKVVKDYPMGVGYGAMTNRLMRKYWRNVEYGRSHVHNNLLQVLIETGWIGLALYVGWMMHILVTVIRSMRREKLGEGVVSFCTLTLFMLLIAFYMSGLVEYNFGDTEVLMMLCVTIGAIGRRTATKNIT